MALQTIWTQSTPDKLFDMRMVFLKEILKKNNFEKEKKSADAKKGCKITQISLNLLEVSPAHKLFAKSLYPENVGPDLDPNCLTRG